MRLGKERRADLYSQAAVVSFSPKVVFLRQRVDVQSESAGGSGCKHLPFRVVKGEAEPHFCEHWTAVLENVWPCAPVLPREHKALLRWKNRESRGKSICTDN